MDIYNQLKREILEGKIPFGERIRESSIAEKFKLSRTPVREAIRRLAADGLVIISPNKGATVRTFSKEDIINIYNVRSVIEGYACMLAAQNATEPYLKILEDSIRQGEAALQEFKNGSHNEAIYHLLESNQVFHETIAEMTGNTEIPRVLDSTSTLPMMFHGYYWFDDKGMETSVDHHKDILDAFEKHDYLQAKSLMEIHILHGRDNVIKNLTE